jgi:hypothetical protein
VPGGAAHRPRTIRGCPHTLCDPPETFSFRGALAHVVTISAYRHALAIGAMRALSVDDLGYGDPLSWKRSRTGGDS